MRRRDEVLVGLLTIVAAVVLLAGTLWLARGGLARGYPLYAKFSWGAGLKQGQPVLFSGVNVGYVDEVNLLDHGGLVTTLRIYRKQRVPRGVHATIEPNGFFGDMLVALRVDSVTQGMVNPGDTIASGPAGMQISDVIARIDTVGRSLNAFLVAMKKELVDDHGIAQFRTAAKSADSMFKVIARVADEQSKELASTEASLRKAASAIDSTRIDSTMRSLRDGVTHFNAFTDDFRTTLTRFDGILAKIDTGNGSAAKLLNDPGVEKDFRATLQRLDSLMTDFMKNPRKYIKLSIF